MSNLKFPALDPSNYFFNLHALPVLMVSLIILSIGLFVLKQNRRSSINIAFFFECFSTGFWLFTISLVYFSRNPDVAIFWYRYFTFFGVINIMPSLLIFTVVWLGELKAKKAFLITNYALSLLFYVLAITTDKVVWPHELRRYFWGFYPIYRPLTLAFIALFLTQGAIGIARLFFAYKVEKIPIRKRQIGPIAVATLMACPACVDFIPKFTYFPFYPVGYVFMFMYISIVAYSIVRYKAFDIETVLHKTIVWLLTFSFIIIPIIFLDKWFSVYLHKSYVLQTLFWAACLALVAIYLRLVQPRIDHLFHRRQSNLEEISRKFTEDLVQLKGLNQLIQRIENTIADTLYPQKIDIYIYNEMEKKFRLINSRQRRGEIRQLNIDSRFMQWLADNNKIIYREFIDIDPTYTRVREAVKYYFVVTETILAIPLVLNNRLLGIINLSKKQNLKRYSAVDIHFLTTLKNESTIAISNSLLYENIEEQVRQRTKELTDTQKLLIQAEKLATVGTLAGGVAHEINNPLTAILTNVQMLLAADGKMDPEEDKESLELIEEATKRCRTIVQKLMAYAKKPLESADVTPVNLLQVAKNVYSFLNYQMEQDNIRVTINAPNDEYITSGNQNELEQVVTNIVLNARDAIRQLKSGGNIYIALSENKEWVDLEIKDDGPGIPREIFSKIFDPFFTTKDVGRGLGLGLSICQAIIGKHNGLISVQSEQGKGANFTLRLPKKVN